MLVIAGSRAMSGAPRLVSRACLVSGAGLVTVAAPKSVVERLSKTAPAELMYLELPETSRGMLAPGAFSKVVSFVRSRKISCVALGPGLSHEKGVSALVRRWVKILTAPIVLDADGLNAYAGKSPELKKHRSGLILTPHRREFERLFSMKWPEKSSVRQALAKKLSKSYDVTLVLKSHRTLVVGHEHSYENRTGNAGMAKGGAGDVLTGIIAAFVAQGLSVFEAARWAVHFHGKAGDLAVRTKSELGLLASDIIGCLPEVFKNKQSSRFNVNTNQKIK